jgi:uncharacterized membrane protein YfcA
MTTYLLIVALGFAGGVVAGMFGVGGGILFVPALAFVYGLDQVPAEATSLVAILPTVVAGTWRQSRYGNVRWREAAIIGVTAIAGVEAGVRVATSIPEEVLRRLFGLLVLLIAAQLAWRARKPDRHDEVMR